jgi:hypothetical protein
VPKSIYLFTFLGLTDTANAQYGIKIGATMSNLYFPGDRPKPFDGYDIDLRPYLGCDVELVQTNPQSPVVAFNIGIFRRIELSPRFGIQPEIAFSQKGVDFSASDYEDIVYKVKISYIDIPISLSYQYLKKEKALSHLYMGGYCAFKINAVKKVAFHHTHNKTTKLKSVKDMDYGIHAGVDYKYLIKKHSFLFDIRFFLGLNDIFISPESWSGIYKESHKTKITGVNISIGYEWQ